MTDLNFVSVIGRLTKDPELKYTQSGTAKLALSVAVNRSEKQNGQWAERASFFDIVYWGKGAETVNQYLHKGKQVAVSGYLNQERWQSQDGSNRSRIVIVAESVQLLGGDNQNQQPQNYQQRPMNNALQYQQEYSGGQDFPEQIPF